MSAQDSLYGNYTLHLRVHSAKNLRAVTRGFYCKLYLGDSPVVEGLGQRKYLIKIDKDQGSSYQTLHTKLQLTTKKDCPEWNEKFQLNVRNPQREVLTIRIKNHTLIYSPTIGACVVLLRHLQLGQTLDKSFPLYKKDKLSGEIRLQFCLQERVRSAITRRRHSQSSEELIRRLMQKHQALEDEHQRKSALEKGCKNDGNAVGSTIYNQECDMDFLPNSKHCGVSKEVRDITQQATSSRVHTNIVDNKKRETTLCFRNGTSCFSNPTKNQNIGTKFLSIKKREQVVRIPPMTSDFYESRPSMREHRDERPYGKKWNEKRWSCDGKLSSSSSRNRQEKNCEIWSENTSALSGSRVKSQLLSQQGNEFFSRSAHFEDSFLSSSQDEHHIGFGHRGESAQMQRRRECAQRVGNARENHENSYSSSISSSESSMSSSQENSFLASIQRTMRQAQGCAMHARRTDLRASI
ncbi:hypothetical protein CCR75_002526 [Bremia lactucae]|uniref:C2 domain-containing protein n=1 Tax=Bremia lactucae TaxID=4779 RepID=A0A976IHG5_BRELC|nr:hypothetical protein CCR75_002526 [Bremia lactucae]